MDPLTGAHTPPFAAGLLHGVVHANATMPLPKPLGAPSSSDFSQCPWVWKQPNVDGWQLEEMSKCLERLAEGQTRIEALLRDRGRWDRKMHKNVPVNQQPLLRESQEGGRVSHVALTTEPHVLQHLDVFDKISSALIPHRRTKRSTAQKISCQQGDAPGGRVSDYEMRREAFHTEFEAAFSDMQELEHQMSKCKPPEHRLRKMKTATFQITGARYSQLSSSWTRMRGIKSSRSIIAGLGTIVDHPTFDGVCAFMIIFNSVLIGVAVEETITYGQEAKWMEILSHLCNGFFLLELILRMTIQGKQYFLSEEWTWNLFDFCLVVFSIADVILTASVGTASSSSFGSGMKAVKMLRIVRIFRMFRFFHELSLLALMIADSVKSLCWALLMLTIIIYVFAICITQSSSDYKWANVKEERATEEEKEHWDKVLAQFGSIGKTIYYLVLSMLGGINWGEISDTLMGIDTVSTCLFYFYVFFTLLAVLNIITGVFVDNAVETARTQRDYLAAKERQFREKYVADMRHFFEVMDEDGSGTVTLVEMKTFLKDDRIRNMFAALGIDTQDMERLFLLLDDDHSGEINVDEFLEGCLRLKGDAKSIDVHTCLAVSRRIMKRIDDLFPDGDGSYHEGHELAHG